MIFRNTAQAKHSFLNAPFQCSQRLRAAYRYPFPVRVRQHYVAKHVNKRLTAYSYSESRSPGEISLERFACTVFLGKEHRPLRPLTGPPLFESALERTEVARMIPIRIPLQKILEQRLCLQLRCIPQTLCNLRPISSKGSDRVRHVLGLFNSDGSFPNFKYLVAVLRLIPERRADSPTFPVFRISFISFLT